MIYTVLTKKEWKLQTLSIIMGACYGIALISGIAVMNIVGVAVLSVIHKASAVLSPPISFAAWMKKEKSNKK